MRDTLQVPVTCDEMYMRHLPLILLNEHINFIVMFPVNDVH